MGPVGMAKYKGVEIKDCFALAETDRYLELPHLLPQCDGSMDYDITAFNLVSLFEQALLRLE